MNIYKKSIIFTVLVITFLTGYITHTNDFKTANSKGFWERFTDNVSPYVPQAFKNIFYGTVNNSKDNSIVIPNNFTIKPFSSRSIKPLFEKSNTRFKPSLSPIIKDDQQAPLQTDITTPLLIFPIKNSVLEKNKNNTLNYLPQEETSINKDMTKSVPQAISNADIPHIPQNKNDNNHPVSFDTIGAKKAQLMEPDIVQKEKDITQDSTKRNLIVAEEKLQDITDLQDKQGAVPSDIIEREALPKAQYITSLQDNQRAVTEKLTDQEALPKAQDITDLQNRVVSPNIIEQEALPIDINIENNKNNKETDLIIKSTIPKIIAGSWMDSVRGTYGYRRVNQALTFIEDYIKEIDNDLMSSGLRYNNQMSSLYTLSTIIKQAFFNKYSFITKEAEVLRKRLDILFKKKFEYHTTTYEPVDNTLRTYDSFELLQEKIKLANDSENIIKKIDNLYYTQSLESKLDVIYLIINMSIHFKQQIILVCQAIAQNKLENDSAARSYKENTYTTTTQIINALIKKQENSLSILKNGSKDVQLREFIYLFDALIDYYMSKIVDSFEQKNMLLNENQSTDIKDRIISIKKDIVRRVDTVEM